MNAHESLGARPPRRDSARVASSRRPRARGGTAYGRALARKEAGTRSEVMETHRRCEAKPLIAPTLSRGALRGPRGRRWWCLVRDAPRSHRTLRVRRPDGSRPPRREGPPPGSTCLRVVPGEHGSSCTRGGRATGDPSGSSGAVSTAARGRADKTPPGGNGKHGEPIPLEGGAHGADRHRQLSIWTAHPLADTMVWIRPTIRARTQWARSHASGQASAGSRLRGDGLAQLPPERLAGQDSQSVRIGSRRPERSSRFRTSRRRGSPPTGRGEANLTFGPGRWMPHARVPEWPARSSVRAALWSRPSGWPPSRRFPGAQWPMTGSPAYGAALAGIALVVQDRGCC